MTADNKSTLIAIDNLCRPSKLDVGISKSIHAKSAKWSQIQLHKKYMKSLTRHLLVSPNSLYTEGHNKEPTYFCL